LEPNPATAPHGSPRRPVLQSSILLPALDERNQVVHGFEVFRDYVFVLNLYIKFFFQETD